MALLSMPSSFARAFTRTPLFVALAKTISVKPSFNRRKSGPLLIRHPCTTGSIRAEKLVAKITVKVSVVSRRALPPGDRGFDAAFGERGGVIVFRIDALLALVGLARRHVH